MTFLFSEAFTVTVTSWACIEANDKKKTGLINDVVLETEFS
jgi:hypothetical protein